MNFGIRVIAERAILRLGTADIAWVIEMTLDEARLTRAALDRAIDRIESGDSVAEDFASFMHSIPDHTVI